MFPFNNFDENYFFFLETEWRKQELLRARGDGAGDSRCAGRSKAEEVRFSLSLSLLARLL